MVIDGGDAKPGNMLELLNKPEVNNPRFAYLAPPGAEVEVDRIGDLRGQRSLTRTAADS